MKKILLFTIIALSFFGANAQNPIKAKPTIKIIKDGGTTALEAQSNTLMTQGADGLFTIDLTGATPILRLPDLAGTGNRILAVDADGDLVRTNFEPGAGPSFGTDNQIPYTNAGGTDFDYSSNFTFDGTTATINNLRIDGSTLRNAGLNDTFLYGAATTDGSDNNGLFLSAVSQGGATRGAFLNLYGNEYTSFGGWVKIESGNVSGSLIEFTTGGAQRATINTSGTWDFNANILSDIGRADIGSLVFNGSTIRDINTNELVIFNTTASAINEIEVTNAATGAIPLVQIKGNLTDATSGTGLELGDDTSPHFATFSYRKEASEDNGYLAIAGKSGGNNLRIYGDGRIEAQNIHNNGTVTGGQFFASGTYTPTLTSVTNVASSFAPSWQWMRLGNTVIVSGEVQIDPTSGSTTTELGVSIPIPSDFTNTNDCGGAANAIQIFGLSAAMRADATNDRINIRYIADSGAGNSTFSAVAMYVVK